jgi:acyl-coenzyme A thioesterase PaaI-like protein
MDLTELLVTDRRCLTVAPLTDAVRSPTGHASLSMALTMFDVGASHAAIIAGRPDWTATQDVSLHSAAAIITGPIVVDSQLVRVGKKAVIVSATVYDGGGVDDVDKLQRMVDQAGSADGAGGLALAGAGLITFARIPRVAASGMDEYDPGAWVGQVRRHNVDAPAAEGSTYERLGLRLLDAGTGQVELDRTPYVTNSIGTILGGAQAIMIEAAAEAMRPGMAVTDLQIHFLSQVRTGPARTVGTALRDAADHTVVTVQLTDAGHHDQILALATVTLQAADRAAAGAVATV